MENKDLILNKIDSIKDKNLKNCEYFFFYEFNDLKVLHNKYINKGLKFKDVQNIFYKEYGFIPSILMLCYLNKTYEDYFKSRF